MIGLEYILQLWGMQHQELAEKLGIRKQNINLWLSGIQSITKKYLPILSQIFRIDELYFQKEINDGDKLSIQRKKLLNEIKEKSISANNNGERLSVDGIEKELFEIVNIDFKVYKQQLIERMDNILKFNIDDDSMNEYEMLLLYIELTDVFEQVSLGENAAGKLKVIKYIIDSIKLSFFPEWVDESRDDKWTPTDNTVREKIFELLKSEE